MPQGGDLSDGNLRGVCSSQLTARRVQPHGLEILRNREAEILPKVTLQGPDPDPRHAAQILAAHGSVVILLDELLCALAAEGVGAVQEQHVQVDVRLSAEP